MKARRAIVDHAVFGGAYVIAGIVALALCSGRAEHAFGALGAALTVAVLATTAFVVVMTTRGLREIPALPESATILPWHAGAIREALSTAVPVALVVGIALSPSGQAWVLGLGYAVLGTACCGSALLAAHTERRRGIRILRADNRYFLSR